MAASTTSSAADVPSIKECNTAKTKSETAAVQDATRQERLARNQEMVKKYHSMFPKIPTMTSQELVARWKAIDNYENERDDSESSDEDDDEIESIDENAPGPLLLIDCRSKAERNVSMIQGGLAMDDMETTKWINKYVHHFDGVQKGGMPTIVTYCTIGYRSGREAQWLVDDLIKTFGIDIGKSVEVKNLDGILAYSFVKDAPPLLRPCLKGSSDSFMTRRIHSYGKEWAEAADPTYDIVYFEGKVQKAKHLAQTGLVSAFRLIQHQVRKSTTKAMEKTTIVAKTCVEPVANMVGTSVKSDSGKKNNSPTGQASAKRISATGYTSNASTQHPSKTDSH